MRILYLHGFASGPASTKAAFFRHRIPSLEIPDLAAGDFEHLTITSQLQVIERLAAGDPVSLIGSSMGGYLAALYAALAWREAGFLDVYHYGEKRNRRLSYQLLEDGLRYEEFPDFKQPALIFHGIHDTVVPPRASADFAASHPNARLRLLDSDHELLNVLEIIWKEAGPFLIP